MAPKTQGIRFEIHLEEWNHALHIDGRGHKSPIYPLFNLLDRYNITPDVYELRDWWRENNPPGWFWKLKIKWANNWKSHGEHHYYDEKADRSPYFNQEGQPGLCGGFFFRVLPLWFIKREVRRCGLFYIHPHDIDGGHPHVRNPFLNWKRQVGTKGALKKLERLIKSGIFGTRSSR